MGFFQKIKSAVYNPDFYLQIKNQGLGSAFKYFFLLILLLTLVNTIILSYELGVKIPGEVKNFLNQSVDNFPDDLEVTNDDGQISTNADEPFFVPMPNSETKEYEPLNNLLVIDTQTPYSATQFEQYKTLFWLTKDSLFYKNNREYDQRSIPLKDFDSFTINKQFVQNLALTINPWLNFVGPLLILLTFIGFYLGYTFNLVYFLFLAVLIFFLSAIFKWGLNYSSSYKTAIYASTAAFLIDLILFNTGVYTGFFGFPFLFTLTALCVATVNLQNFEQKS